MSHSLLPQFLGLINEKMLNREITFFNSDQVGKVKVKRKHVMTCIRVDDWKHYQRTSLHGRDPLVNC